ncbi:MAG: class I SAM-dependent methyltransferase [Candidatus Eremiobacteraeota bacterium]|nr:class I SAM-dependent methyltransferase [Candidatus Eremiobacteraeota bacterium]
MTPAVSPLQQEQPQQRADLIRQMFDRVWGRYDLNNALLSFGLDWYWRRRARKMLALRPTDRVIDLCCGTGAVTRCLAQAVPQGEVVGVDFSDGMLTPARRHKGAPGAGPVRYICSDVLEVPLPENSFDALTICYGPRNIVDLPKLWKEMQRLVKPGGQVLSLELTRPPGIMGYFHELYLKFVVPFVGGIVSGDPEAYRYLQKTISGFLSPTEMADSMREAGLVQVKVVPLSGGIVTIHHARTPLSR